MKGLRIVMMSLVAAFVFASCGTTKKVVADEPVVKDTVAVDTVSKPAVVVKQVPSHPEIISIAEAVELWKNREVMDSIAQKYTYKRKTPYVIFRLDKYDVMLYKNCWMPRILGKNIYEDTPRPKEQGVSSCVAVGSSVVVRVFNDKAYANLLEQVQGLGFTLEVAGYEDKYTNGEVDIFCHKERKSFRITKKLY